MSLSKFLKSPKWVDLCFWLCIGCMPINMAMFFMAAHLKDQQLQLFVTLNMVVLAVGAVLNYFRAEKPKS